MNPLCHTVPRLDRPFKVWLLPAPQAKWLSAALFSGPIVAQLHAILGLTTPEGAWSLPIVWLAWLVGAVVGVTGAFYRPGGLHIGEWFAALVSYALVPRRTTWRPGG